MTNGVFHYLRILLCFWSVKSTKRVCTVCIDNHSFLLEPQSVLAEARTHYLQHQRLALQLSTQSRPSRLYHLENCKQQMKSFNMRVSCFSLEAVHSMSQASDIKKHLIFSNIYSEIRIFTVMMTTCCNMIFEQ